MAIPRDIHARRYHRAAFQRLEEGDMLRRSKKPTGAVYLAGYGVECMLKALIVTLVAEGKREAVRASFRGGAGHDFARLRREIVTRGVTIPVEIQRALLLVGTRSTDLRYEPATIKESDAVRFIEDAKR